MRKLVVICLVAVALAGAEQWITPQAAHHYTIPNPKPAVLPFAPGIFMPAVDTLKYDDNMAATAWAQNQAGGGWGMKFISPSDDVTLTGALIDLYDNTWPDPGGDRVMVKVFADDGPDGSPGTDLWDSDTLTLVRGQFNWVPIGVPIVAENFYIFYVQPDSYPVCPGLSIDAFNNAPSGTKWGYRDGGFSPDNTVGDWMIRAVIDWTPQDHNAAALYFASNMPADTTPGINLSLKVVIKNFGNSEVPAGTPVRIDVTGPSSYEYQDTFLTTAALQHGQTGQCNFTPAWHIPSNSGVYTIKAWVEAAGEQFPANDTIHYDLSVARWIEYANFSPSTIWIVNQRPERAVLLNPADFGLAYPVGISRVRAGFIQYPSAWHDTTFIFRLYDESDNLLYESPNLEAIPGTVGSLPPPTSYTLDSMVIIPSGSFYVAVAPISTTGNPSSAADDSAQGHSYVGGPGSRNPFSLGEFMMSASVQPNAPGVAEDPGFDPSLRGPSLRIATQPNPARGIVTFKWQVPTRQRYTMNLYDATGRLAVNLFTGSQSRVGSLAFDTRTVAAGIYLVRLESGQGTVTRKLVVER